MSSCCWGQVSTPYVIRFVSLTYAPRNRAKYGYPTYRYYYTGNFSNITPLPWIGATHSGKYIISICRLSSNMNQLSFPFCSGHITSIAVTPPSTNGRLPRACKVGLTNYPLLRGLLTTAKAFGSLSQTTPRRTLKLERLLGLCTSQMRRRWLFLQRLERSGSSWAKGLWLRPNASRRMGVSGTQYIYLQVYSSSLWVTEIRYFYRNYSLFILSLTLLHILDSRSF